ncbi:macro domain-containing protein [Streptomyces sp. NPDC021224]|uniref:macro domain-containing protein n=1 Tax=unclassified Streptomyces TaxID=2593676 RepID=UPI00378B030B
MVEIEVVQGDITQLPVDAIVNAANESLGGGGGVDGAIHYAAGRALAPCPRGEARTTPAFDLDPPVRHVIHTVGPAWHGGVRGEAATLASCYRACLAEADAVGARTVAFPAVSTGIFGYPADKAARIAVTTLRSCPTAVERVLLVAFDKAARKVLEAALAESPAGEG